MRRELALLALMLGACDREPATDPRTPATPQPTAPTAVPAGALAGAEFYRVELAPLSPCAAAQPCEARLVVHALGEFKVNVDYPHKLVATPTPEVAVEGTGTFTSTEPNQGVLTVTFRATRTGTARIAGTLKLSVCTDDVCEIESPQIAFDVPVS